jgi:pimeloyl-ACP methyl ester carboxylesterase
MKLSQTPRKDSAMSQQPTIYRSAQFQTKLMAIYDSKLDEWPVPYESVYVDTSFGKVHVIISGPQDAPAALLLHASAMSAWSWVFNINSLSRFYRTYAIDHIGEAGKSELNDLKIYPQEPQELSDLYLEISKNLGVESSVVIGASNGGFLSINYTIYNPERVKKLVLLGPMGVSPPRLSMGIRMGIVSLLPLNTLLVRTSHWAIGVDLGVQEKCGEWFITMMQGVIPKVAFPKFITPKQKQSIKVPVLLFLGTKDNVVGGHEKAIENAQYLPDVQIEVLESGHLIGVEHAETINNKIAEFLVS